MNEPIATAVHPRSWQRFPALPLLCNALFFLFLLLPNVRESAGLFWTFVGVGAALVLWQAALWVRRRLRGQHFPVEFAAFKSHYVQAAVQLGIYAYWGWYEHAVLVQAPLILAQVLFLYTFDALLSWTRGRTWRFGYGALPIIFSTNLLLWFKNDWYFLQFAMIAAGALGKEFIRWNREGRKTHIFNPSVFGQTLFAIGLIATATTGELTWGKEIAASFETPPHMFIVIFTLGLIVQYLFSVTLISFSGVAALCLLNLAYTWITGSYYFISINIGATVFLGLHLLVTDPATSPRSNLGRVIFGALYGLGYFLLFRVLYHYGIPLFWDKLLPVPILNLCVPLIDRFVQSGVLGRLNRWWQEVVSPKAANLLHMGGWTALFVTMVVTGFVQGDHEGSSIAFWRKAYLEDKPDAAQNLLNMVKYGVQHDFGEAHNMMGLLKLEGDLVERDLDGAAEHFARACELDYLIGCENVAGAFLFEGRARSRHDVTLALQRLEEECEKGRSGQACFLVGFAYEFGRSLPRDRRKALEYLEAGCRLGNEQACSAIEKINPFRNTRVLRLQEASSLAPPKKQ